MHATLKATLRRAVERGLAGDWEGAHAVAQDHEGEPTADWIHAVAHRMEGDVANAGYWYRRCGRPQPEGASFDAEWREIEAALREE
jgi:hypothetical protein